MSYLNYDGLAYFKSKLTNWVDQNYLSKTNTGNTTVAGNVTFTKPITGDLDGKAKKDWLGQKIDETYIKEIATNNNAGTIVYTKGNGSTNHILIDLLQGATPIANGRAGLVPAPTVSEMNYFLRGDGNWAVPTDVYVNQNLIASSNNNQFPVLLSGTSGTPATKTNATVGYTNVVSVNPLTNALMASQFISKHPTYNRQSAVTSKVQYSLNFTDIVSGVGHNLGEVVGYVDTLANGGEHELGLRLFGNPNVQGTEEDYVYMGVGLSKTNVAYGHAPSTPLPSAHNEPTDIITRDWLARNGSETGLVHTTMDETIDGTKTFVKKIVANDGMNATGNIASDTLTIRQDATVGRDLAVTRNETVGGTLTTTGNISTASGNISTTNGTISGKTGSIGTGGLTVTGPSNLNGKVTAGNGLDVTGNETVSGNLTVGGTTTTEDLHVTDDATIDDTITVGGQILKKTGNTTQEYVSYVTNQQETRNAIITNVIKPNGGLAVVSSGADKGKIYVKTGNALEIDSSGFVNVDFSKLPPEQVKSIVDRMVDPDGAIIGSTQERIPAGETYHYYDNNGNLVSAVAPAGGIVNPNYGKLTVDFSKLSDSQIEKIVLSMIAQDGQGNLTGGLATDDNGKLIVDFSQMPDDRFDTLKASLGMQRTVTSSTRIFYVDYDNLNASDTVYTKATGFDGERGLSLGKPFKTISGAVTGITTYYSLGTQNVTIYVVPRTIRSDSDLATVASDNYSLTSTNKTRIAKLFKLDASNTEINAVTSMLTTQQKNIVKNNLVTYPYYKEYLSLPTYNRTSGVITICGYIPEGMTENNSYVVANGEDVAPMPKIFRASICDSAVNINGRYNLRYLELYNRIRDPGNSVSQFPTVVSVSEGGYVAFFGIQEHFEFYGHRGAVGTVEISSNTAPTNIIINNTASTTNAVPVMSDGEFLGYKYSYDTSTHKEAERERPELVTTSTVNIDGTNTTFNNYITITSCTYNTTTKKIVLNYTFERGAEEIASTTFYVKVDNNNFITVASNYDTLGSRTGIYARMNTAVNGKIFLGIADKLNTKFTFNLGEKHSSTETFVPNLNMFSTLCIFRAERNGKIENGSSATITVPYTNIYCKGNMTNFIEVSSMSSYDNVSGQVHHMHYVVKPGDTVTGRPYTLTGGSGMAVPHAIIEQVTNGVTEWVSGNAGYGFPGTNGVHGTVEDEEGFNSENPNYSYRKGGSGCWYREYSSLGL